jgi:hypothetical protein
MESAPSVFSLPRFILFFFTLAVQICFCLPYAFLKYGLLLAIASLLFRALILGNASFFLTGHFDQSSFVLGGAITRLNVSYNK